MMAAGSVILYKVIRKKRIEEYNKNTKIYYMKQGNDDKIYGEYENYYTMEGDYKTEFMNSLKPEGSFMGHDIFSRTKKP